MGVYGGTEEDGDGGKIVERSSGDHVRPGRGLGVEEHFVGLEVGAVEWKFREHRRATGHEDGERDHSRPASELASSAADFADACPQRTAR